METIQDFLIKTESATKKLFEGIESYLQIFNAMETPVFFGDYRRDESSNKEYEEWSQKNITRIDASINAQERYVGELFAQATLCGALLQIAATGIKNYSQNEKLSPDVINMPNINHAKKFCVGRLVNNVPLGLIIYAARNQYNHFSEGPLREPSNSIFNKIAQIGPSSYVKEPYLNSFYDLENEKITIFASNVTSLIGWRNYPSYENDMINMLHNKTT